MFPDAVVIQTHRNPVEVLRSSMQLTEVLEGTFARAEDPAQTRIREARSLAEHMEGITSFREAHPKLDGRFIDIKYHELVADPLTVVREIYQRLDKRLTKMAAAGMQSLASKRSRYKGRHGSRTLENLGMDGPTLTQRFEGYCSRFGIPCQHREWR